MQLIDEILEYLQYHPMSGRQDIEGHLSGKVSSATVKRQIAKGIEDGLIVSHGNNRSTVYAITPKAHILLFRAAFACQDRRHPLGSGRKHGRRTVATLSPSQDHWHKVSAA